MNENDWLNVWEFKQQLLEISLIHIFRRWRRCKLSWFNCCFCFCCCSAADVDADVADSMSATFVVVVVVWLHLARLNDLEHAVCFFLNQIAWKCCTICLSIGLSGSVSVRRLTVRPSFCQSFIQPVLQLVSVWCTSSSSRSWYSDANADTWASNLVPVSSLLCKVHFGCIVWNFGRGGGLCWYYGRLSCWCCR